jgi:hypothetical protein
MNTIKLIAAAAGITWAAAAFAQHSGHGQLPGHLHTSEHSQGGTSAALPSYAGQESRAIKSLSDADVKGLLSGAGAGYAKAAELNGYPGPAHVIELAAQLQLSAEQLSASQKLMARHKEQASKLGAQLVAAERALDTAFASRSVNAQRLQELTQGIGVLQASLRAEHLQTHLEQTAVLSAAQIARYNALRGYTSAALPQQSSTPAAQ